MKRNEESSIEDRLRAALVPELPTTAEGVDMSPRAVADRLRDACEMSSLALDLVAAGAALRA